jgi:pimeloyl-ACP methyl ester carboxylesterase
MAERITPGAVRRISLDGMPLDYFVYLPEQGQREGRVFVTVHGISRNAEEHLHGFLSQAEVWGAAMIAPLFSEASFPRYQRLGNTIHDGRADLAFDRLLQDAEERLGIRPSPLRIFGFSGGGQFAHRYAMFYPKRVARVVLGAPGWYTFPDPDRLYPYGLRSSPDWPKLNFSPANFLQVPALVLVGDEDDIRDGDLNKMRRVDATQGLNRLERGQRWVGAMRALACAYGVPSDFRIEQVPNANHAYESYLAHPPFAEQVFGFLFGSAP